MPRQKRRFIPGVVYHLIARFVGSEYFIHDDAKRFEYLRLVGAAAKNTDWKCLSFGIMSNHVHYGAVAGTEPLSAWLHEPHTLFAEAINQERGRQGGVFSRGPTAHAVDPLLVARLIGYHHMNPVRAGVVAAPQRSDWTSQRAYLGQVSYPWVDTALGLSLAGCESGEEHLAWTLETHARGELAGAELVPRRRGRKRAS